MEFYELPETEQQALKRAFPDHPTIPQLASLGKVSKRGSWVMIEVQNLLFSLILVERATTISSEIAKLREQIELEIESMHQGLVGLAVVAKHQFIEARYHRLGQLEDELATHIGETQAAQFSCQAYIRLVEGK